MALQKVNYIDNQTTITAKNMNDMQDAIIEAEKNAADAKTTADEAKTAATGAENAAQTAQTEAANAQAAARNAEAQAEAAARSAAATDQLAPEFANDISECSDTSKLYVLPDGYIYANINGAWTNTRHAFVPADYEPRIFDLESEVSAIKNSYIQDLEGKKIIGNLSEDDFIVNGVNEYGSLLGVVTGTMRVTTVNALSLSENKISISCKSPYQYFIYFSTTEDIGTGYLGKTAWTDGNLDDVMNAALAYGTKEGALYCRISFRNSADETSPVGLIPEFLENVSVTKYLSVGEPKIATRKWVTEITDRHEIDIRGEREKYPLTSGDFIISNVSTDGSLMATGLLPRVTTAAGISLTENKISISCKSPYQYFVYFSTTEDIGTGYLGKTAWTDGNLDDVMDATLASGTKEGALYCRISFRDGTNPNAASVDYFHDCMEKVSVEQYVQLGEPIVATREWVINLVDSFTSGIDTGGIEDVPETIGQMACLARAAQMRDIRFIPKTDMPMDDSARMMPAGYGSVGIWYSSVRGTEWGFIGYGVSMYSLLTAIHNPKSIIYTKRYADYFPADTASNGAENVYGTNCSSYVSYCLDLPYLAVTNVFPHLPYWVDECGIADTTGDGMCYDTTTGAVVTNRLQKVMKLGDFLIGTGEFGSNAGHAVIVTGIRRNRERLIVEVDISDSWWGKIRRITYTWGDFVQKFITDEKYRVYRYAYMDDVTFPENLNRIAYSNICTNRGDKISIRPDQDISLNVLNVGIYTGIALFKDGKLLNTKEISVDSPDWELTNLTTGKYTAVVYSGTTPAIGDATATNSTSFIVCNVNVTRSGDTFTYSAEAINGAYPKPMQIAVKQYEGLTLDVKTLDGENFSGNGSAEFILSDYHKTVSKMIHIPFKTEYGFVIAESGY